VATITGTPGDDVLDGTPDPDDIFGLDGDDNLDGKAGADQLVGGVGNDSYWVDTAGDSVTELAGQGNDRVYASVSWTLGAGQSVETLLTNDSAGTAAINLTGNEFDNILIGNAGANILNGGLGRDVLIGLDGDDILIGGSGIANQMQGGRGRDVYFVSVVGDTIVELAGEGTDQVRTALSQYVLSANIEELVYTGTGNFYGVGNDGDNTIVGGTGSDSLDGGLGADNLSGGAGDDFLTGGSGAANVMAGGPGRDVYYVSAAGDSIFENAGEGNDQVRTALASFTLSANVEELVYTGTGSFSGTGNDGDNIIIGGIGGDTLNGGLGADIVAGGDGDDILIGGDGAANTLIGGLGRDIYFVSAVGDSVVENAGEGIDQIRTALNRYVAAPANVEELVFTGTGDFVGTLGAGSTFISGGAGNDILTSPTGNLRGFAGDDALYGLGRLEGGTGNDRYFVGTGERSSADNSIGNRRAFENPGEGIDEVITSGILYYLDPDVENLTYVGAGGFTAYGNSVANIITGGPGGNRLNAVGSGDTLIGGFGLDLLTSSTVGTTVMRGGGGNDSYYVNKDPGGGALPDVTITENADEGMDGVRTDFDTFTLSANVENLIYTGSGTFVGNGNSLANILSGGPSSDTLNGLDGNDTLRGYNGADILNGGNGDDDIGGGLGNDILNGGAGRDSFLFDTALDGVNNNDAVPDFMAGIDRFLLDRTIFTGLATGQLSGIAFGFGSIATTADQRILYDPTTGSIRYDPDGAGGAAGIIFAHVATQMTTLSAADFVVI
jgi:Ca2+-binding RTX toxin-like protein